MLRRLLTGFGLVVLQAHPFFQCYFLMMFSIINFIYQWTEKPMEESLENRLELVNEYSILLCAYTMNVFSNTAISPELARILGWAFIGIAVFNIAVNVIAMCFT
jgi:hypothetical protein